MRRTDSETIQLKMKFSFLMQFINKITCDQFRLFIIKQSSSKHDKKPKTIKKSELQAILVCSGFLSSFYEDILILSNRKLSYNIY